jgi:hypothetical protein
MESKINNKMEKRLKWLNPDEDRQSAWLAKHLINNPLKSDISILKSPPPFSSYNSTNNFTKIFLECAYCWPETPNTREICKNLKAAWKSWDKRNKNEKNPTFHESSYSISIKARAELERLAKGKTKKSLSSVIDTLLLDAVSIKTLQKQLNKVIKGANCGVRLHYDFFSTFFSDDKVNEQAAIINQKLNQDLAFKENELKNEKIKSTILEDENSKSKNEMDRMRERIVSFEEENYKLKKSEEAAKKELDDYLES